MKKCKIWWSVLFVDSLLYGCIASYIGDSNVFINIWALLRYIVVFLCIAGFSQAYKEIRLSKKGIMVLCLSSLNMLFTVILGYYLSTLLFLRTEFILTVIVLIIVASIGLVLFYLSFKYCDKYKHIEKINYNISNENEKIRHILDSNDDKRIDMINGMNYYGVSIVLLIIFYVVIPIFIRNTSIDLEILFTCGVVCFVIFSVTNYRKYKYSRIIGNSFYYLEMLCLLVGTALMYYVDGFVYRGLIVTNFILIILYSLLVIPFVLTGKRLATNYYLIMSKIEDKKKN